VRSSNPVLGRLAQYAGQQATFHAAPASNRGVPGAPGGYVDVPPIQTRRMTLDDVVLRTVMLLVVTGAVAAASWLLLPAGPEETLALYGALGIGLVLGLVISFARITNPVVIVAYAAVEGVLLGVISRFFESYYSGVVLQAVVGTFGVFLGMAALYKFRVIRATPRFVKWVTGAVIGVVLLMLVNFGLSLFGVGANGGQGLGLREYSMTGSVGIVPVLFSVLCIAIAALTFVLDFAAIEDGVRAGVDERYAWYASFGILVGLIWLYLEILRLLGYGRR
jgi:uncharacterized YccA/Bax inhibitor family protein